MCIWASLVTKCVCVRQTLSAAVTTSLRNEDFLIYDLIEESSDSKVVGFENFSKNIHDHVNEDPWWVH